LKKALDVFFGEFQDEAEHNW